MMLRSIARKSFIGVSSAALAVCLALTPGVGHAQERAQGFNNFPQVPGLSASADAGYLGISLQEITADRAKELKLPAVRGAFVAEVADNSPAAKAGVKKGDVITEYNGQRVEGTMQLARMVRETPSGHTAELSVWRDGRTQTLSPELGRAAGEFEDIMRGMNPRRMAPPDGPQPGDEAVPPPNGNFGLRSPSNPQTNPGGNARGNPRDGARETPTLGVAAQDMTAQLGGYFGVPSGEGVLVTDVHKGSAGEKAGLKAGDVITKVEGQAVRNIGELRTQLREKRDAKSVTLTVVRDGKETSVSVEPEKPQSPASNSDRRIPL